MPRTGRKLRPVPKKHRDPRFSPYAFAEDGAIMAATVINSPRAVEMSIYVVRAFVHLRELLASNKELAQQLKILERKVSAHDEVIVGILKTIRQLMQPPEPSKRSQTRPQSCATQALYSLVRQMAGRRLN